MATTLRELIDALECSKPASMRSKPPKFGYGALNPREIYRDGKPVVGFGDATVSSPTVRAPSPWAVAITTSVVGAAVGWVIEEIAVHVRGRRS